jgi:maleate isomerase
MVDGFKSLPSPHPMTANIDDFDAARVVVPGVTPRCTADPGHVPEARRSAAVGDAFGPSPAFRKQLKMTDVLGWRRKFGVLGPSTNTIVQPDFDAMRPLGVTNHYSRIFTPNANAVSNESFRAGAEVIASNVLDAVRSIMTCSPDYLVMGMSAVTFFDGAKGADAFTRQVEETSGVRISIGSDSCTAAMQTYGGVRRIAILSPYWPSMNTEVARYFSDKGFEVVRDKCLQCRSWIQIAEQSTETLRQALRELDGDDVDAIVQVGTNLSMVRLAAAAELWLGKPIIAINTATYWHALRANGIKDRMEGFGRLLSEF